MSEVKFTQEVQDEREVKRGQVFYLSTNEPYIVLSNNQSNETSEFVHAAPIKDGTGDASKYYHCPFSGTCHKSKFVDVSETTLIPKSKFTDRTYSAAQSYYTVNNAELLSLIDEALCQQLGITKNYVVYGEAQTTQSQRNPEPIQVTINMNITGLDTNATPVTITAEPVITAVQKKKPDVFIEPEQVRKSVETVATMTATMAEEKVVPKTNKGSHGNYVRSMTPNKTRFGDSERDKIVKTIQEKSKHFNGTMTNVQIAKELGVSLTTVNRYVQKVHSNSGVKYKFFGRKRSVYAPFRNMSYKGLTFEAMETLTRQYNENGAKWMVDTYPQMFKNISSVYAFLTGYCYKVNDGK